MLIPTRANQFSILLSHSIWSLIILMSQYTHAHMYFIILETSKDEGWRCPGCRTLSLTVPSVYKCFCGKMVEPVWTPSNKFQVPHSCGELCGRRLATDKSLACMHKCRLLCHPGPCPPCPVTVSTHCPCGKKPYPF